MDDLAGVRDVQGAAHLLVHRDDRLDGKNALLFDKVLERLTLQEFHGQIEDAVVFPEVVHGNDIGVG